MADSYGVLGGTGNSPQEGDVSIAWNTDVPNCTEVCVCQASVVNDVIINLKTVSIFSCNAYILQRQLYRMIMTQMICGKDIIKNRLIHHTYRSEGNWHLSVDHLYDLDFDTSRFMENAAGQRYFGAHCVVQ